MRFSPHLAEKACSSVSVCIRPFLPVKLSNWLSAQIPFKRSTRLTLPDLQVYADELKLLDIKPATIARRVRRFPVLSR
jgi:hypothetical protein